ncbi:MAG TPA: enoyl-CoA hydratase/isomerase family protein [Acidimicrobiales bacterium]|nr:enoyl-CoA hydratase/isomerase family protein [Acidimicrobiales bacterium]
MTILSPVDALDLVAGGVARVGTDGRNDPQVMVVELRRGEALASLGRRIRQLPCVLIGVADDDDLRAPRGFDVLLSPVAEPPAPWVGSNDPLGEATELVARVHASPQAATALVELLRMSETMTITDAIIAESFVYSMLQSGPAFRAWLAGRAHSAVPSCSESPVMASRIGDHLEIQLHRPHVHNAFNSAMRDALIDVFAVAVADPSVRSVRLSGAGASFCSGGDLTEFGSAPDPVTAHGIRITRSVGALVASCAERVVVDVHGACIGAGIEIPAFAGRVTAAPDAFFALPELALGLIPGAGGTASIVRRIGRLRTTYLALRQCEIDAPWALAWGLVDEIGAGRG